jgi:hypothetical protein
LQRVDPSDGHFTISLEALLSKQSLISSKIVLQFSISLASQNASREKTEMIEILELHKPCLKWNGELRKPGTVNN